MDAAEAGIIKPILVGPAAKVRDTAAKHSLNIASYEIVDAPHSEAAAIKLRKQLLSAGIYPALINYLGGPGNSYFRFVISSEHTQEQLDALIDMLRQSNQ